MATIDDFEDNDISEYTGNTGAYDNTSSPVHDGSWALDGEAETNGASRVLISNDGDGLDSYPTRNVTIEFYMRFDTGRSGGGMFFGVAAGSDKTNVDGYSVEIDNDQNRYIYRWDNGSKTVLASDSVSPTYDPGVWYKVTINFGTSNDSAEIQITDDAHSSFLTTTDNTYDGGGVGWIVYSTISRSDVTWFDTATDDTASVSAPSTPQNLTAVTQADNDILVDWDAVNWNGDQGHYDVYRSTTSGSGYTQVQQVASGTTQWTDTTVLDGERYYYIVDATNSAGTSGDSNEADALTDLPAPSNLSATENGADQIDLAWTDNSDNEDNFLIERDSGSGFSQIDSVGANTTSYSDTGLTADTSYTYRVRASTEHINSNYSNQDSATTAGLTVTDDGSITGATATVLTTDETTLAEGASRTGAVASVLSAAETTLAEGATLVTALATTLNADEATLASGAQLLTALATALSADEVGILTTNGVLTTGAASPLTASEVTLASQAAVRTGAVATVLTLDETTLAEGASPTPASAAVRAADETTVATEQGVLTVTATVLTTDPTMTLTISPGPSGALATPLSPNEFPVTSEAGSVTAVAATPLTAAEAVLDVISGTVTLSGSGVQGAKVYIIDQDSDTVAATATTDANGDYSATVQATPPYHVAVQYDDGSQKYNALSKPWVE